jgi:hypothetical protein
MKKYLFDINVYSFIFSENIPEKWVRYLKGVRSETKKLIIFEMIISEIFYKNSQKYGFRRMRKNLNGLNICGDLVTGSATVIPGVGLLKNACEGYR